MARITIVDRSDYRIKVRENGSIILDVDSDGEVVVTGKLQVGGEGTFGSDLAVEGSLVVNGGEITSSSDTIDIFPENVQTINFGLEATEINIGAENGKTTVNHALEILGLTHLQSHVVLGNEDDTRSVTFVSDVTSNIIPNTSDSYTLGVPNKAWEALYTNKISNSPNKNIAINPVGDSIVDINGAVNIQTNLTVDNTARVRGDLFVDGQSYGTFPYVPNILYVTTEGSDTHDGTAMDPSRACRTISGAIRSPFYRPGTTIRVAPGRYLENNPLLLKPYTSIIGNDLRTTTIEPINKTQDLFHVTSSTYIAQMQFLNGRSGIIDPMIDRGAYCIAFPNTSFAFTGDIVEGEALIKNVKLTENIPIGAELDSSYYDAIEDIVKTYFPEDTSIIGIIDQTTLATSRKSVTTANTVSFRTGKLTIYKSPYIQNCTNQSGPWLKDGTMFIPNQTIQVPKLVGTSTFTENQDKITVTITKGDPGINPLVPGMKINTGVQHLGFFHARTILLANKSFIQQQVVAWIAQQAELYNDDPGSIWYNFKGFYTPYIQEKCRRDAGIILENILYDACFGGNSKSIEAGLAYYNGAVSIVAGQSTQTIAAIEHMLDICVELIKNTPVPPEYNIRVNLTNVTIIEQGVLGEVERKFVCQDPNVSLLIGYPVRVSGALTGTGTISGYTNPTVYYIADTNGRTNFTLSSESGQIVDISQGTTTGLTFTYGLEQVTIPFLGEDAVFAESTIIRNIGLVNDIIENGPSVVPTVYYSTGKEAGLVYAESLLQENRRFLQKEVSAYVSETYPFLFFSDLNETICKRDLNLIIDAVLDDAVFDTNYRSLISGIAYTRSYSSNVTTSQKKQTIAALEIARDKIIENINNVELINTVTDNFKIITDIIFDENDTAAPELYFSETIEVESSLSNAVNLLRKNKQFLMAEVSAWIEYQRENNITPFGGGFSLDDEQKAKCSRDTGYFIDALAYDLLYGGNTQCVSAAEAYFHGTESYIPGQETQTIAAYSYLQSIISNIVQNDPIIPTASNYGLIQYTFGLPGTAVEGSRLQGLLSDVISVISDISVTREEPNYTVGVNFEDYDLEVSLIKSMLDTIKDESIELFKTKFNLKAICERDVGLIVDAVSQDILLGGNTKSIEAAVTYYNAVGYVANSEAAYTANAYKYAKSLCEFVVQNSPIVLPGQYPYQNIVSQYIKDDPEYSKGSIALEQLTHNFNIMIDIIETGIIDKYTRYQGTPLFSATGVSADDVKESTSIEEVVSLGGNVYEITLSKPTVGIGNSSTLYFGYTDVYPLTDEMVEDRCKEYGFEHNAWELRKYDQFGSMGGMLIDGESISEISPIRSFVADAFTQVNQGGRGVRATRRGYVQLVSVFTIFSSISVQTDSGSIMSITNANANFGDYCMVSKGYGPKEFSGTVYNPPELPLYPVGKFPSNGAVNIFVPDHNFRPHISLIMEVEPPSDYVNVQNKPGFLTATVTTSEIIEGSLTIDNIEVFDMFIGQKIYVRDQFGSYVDEELGKPYLFEGTTIVDLGPSTIYLSRPINRGRSEPNNPAFFTIFTCGKAYYTVLTSTPAPMITRSDGRQLQEGELVIPENQIIPKQLSLAWIKELLTHIIQNSTNFVAKQNEEPQVLSDTFLSGAGALARVEELIDLVSDIFEFGPSHLTNNNITPNKKSPTPTPSTTDAAAMIMLNLDFIAAEVDALMVEYSRSYFETNNVEYEYNSDKCLRDAKLIPAKIAEDLREGGNYNSCLSGTSYYAKPNTYHIVTLNDNVRDSGLFRDGTIVNFYQRSYITASGYLFEYVGAGSNYGALPMVGRSDPVQSREVNMLDGGKVFFTSTDQNGDFRIGPGLVIDQAAGVLSGRTFQKSLFAEMTPFILALE